MIPATVITLCLLVTAASCWLSRTPKGRHHRPDGTSTHRPLLVLTQRHYGDRIAPNGRHEILPGLTEVATP